MITYSSYMPREFSLRSSVTIICVGDTLAALLAGALTLAPFGAALALRVGMEQ